MTKVFATVTIRATATITEGRHHDKDGGHIRLRTAIFDAVRQGLGDKYYGPTIDSIVIECDSNNAKDDQ